MSLPEEIFDCLYEQYFTNHKAVDDVKKENQGPPSPQLVSCLTISYYVYLTTQASYTFYKYFRFNQDISLFIVQTNSLWWRKEKESE